MDLLKFTENTYTPCGTRQFSVDFPITTLSTSFGWIEHTAANSDHRLTRQNCLVLQLEGVLLGDFVLAGHGVRSVSSNTVGVTLGDTGRYRGFHFGSGWLLSPRRQNVYTQSIVHNINFYFSSLHYSHHNHTKQNYAINVTKQFVFFLNKRKYRTKNRNMRDGPTDDRIIFVSFFFTQTASFA